MKTLKSLLEKKAKRISPVLDDKTIFFMFKKVLEEEFGRVGAAKFTPDFFKNKTIFVKSESSLWASELFLNKNKIIKGINKELGEETVKYIKLK